MLHSALPSPMGYQQIISSQYIVKLKYFHIPSGSFLSIQCAYFLKYLESSRKLWQLFCPKPPHHPPLNNILQFDSTFGNIRGKLQDPEKSLPDGSFMECFPRVHRCVSCTNKISFIRELTLQVCVCSRHRPVVKRDFPLAPACRPWKLQRKGIRQGCTWGSFGFKMCMDGSVPPR